MEDATHSSVRPDLVVARVARQQQQRQHQEWQARGNHGVAKQRDVAQQAASGIARIPLDLP